MPTAQETNTKARKVFDGLEKLASQYNAAEDFTTAKILFDIRQELPVGSAARLYDILTRGR